VIIYPLFLNQIKKTEIMENSIIKKLELNYSQVRSVVENWYLSIPEIFQSESGLDLDEIVTGNYEFDYYDGNCIDDFNIDLITTLQIVLEWYDVHYLHDEEYDGFGIICNEDDVELDEFIANLLMNNFDNTL
jgi:hypothetical protein